jgi:hypothetical protein
MRIDLLYNISPKVIGARGMKAFIDYQQLSGLTRVEIGDDAKAEGHWENSENYIHFIIPNIESDRVSFDNGELFIGEVEIIDDLVPKQKLAPCDKNIDISDYKMVSSEIVKQTDKEIHISTLWRKGGD